MAMTSYLLKSTIVGALGGLLFGFDTAVIAGTTQQLTLVYNLTSFTLGLTVFIGLAGTVLGAMTAGVLGQRIGGREALPELASMLDDADPEVQRESIRAIVQIGTEEAFAVLERLRGDPATTHIPVIILSNYGEPELRERVHKLSSLV